MLTCVSWHPQLSFTANMHIVTAKYESKMLTIDCFPNMLKFCGGYRGT